MRSRTALARIAVAAVLPSCLGSTAPRVAPPTGTAASAATVAPLSVKPAVARDAPNWAHVAELIVKRSLAVAPGERVVLYHDPDELPALTQAVRLAVAQAGAVVSGEIATPPDAAVRALASVSEPERAARHEQQFQAHARLFAEADVAIWLPTTNSTAPPAHAFERLVEGSRVRSAHFHWFLPPNDADVPAVVATYLRALEISPDRLRARIDALAAAMRGARVRLRSADGTDLTLNVPSDAWFHRNTGDASRAATATARSTRDRETELPSSALRTVDLRGAEGEFVGHVDSDRRAGKVRATFASGRLIRLASLGGEGADAAVRAWNDTSGGRPVDGEPGEIVIGTNPALAPQLPSGFMPYYGTGSGNVRLHLGDNWESGGPTRAKPGLSLNLWLAGATLDADGVPVLADGQWVGRGALGSGKN